MTMRIVKFADGKMIHIKGGILMKLARIINGP